MLAWLPVGVAWRRPARSLRELRDVEQRLTALEEAQQRRLRIFSDRLRPKRCYFNG